MRQRFFTMLVSVNLCLLFFSSRPSEAGGPLLVTKNGAPYVWDTSQPVTFTTDQGPLGMLSNADAVTLTSDLFRTWEEVPTARIRFQPAGQLPTDITGQNVMEFLNSLPPGVNPIIFDTDGTAIEALIGLGARMFTPGAASPLQVEPTDGTIRQATAILNGLFIDGQNEGLRNPELPFALYRATFVHEFGHFIGLDHSALNTPEALDSDTTNDAAIPTMFPQLASEEQATLHLDDIAALSTLYPTPEFWITRGVIRGHVLFPDGSPFQGANVIARNVADPQLTAISSVSGFLHTGSSRGADFGSNDPAWLGFYELSGLPPGQYIIEISSINPTFRSGSSVGPLSPPAPLPGTPLYFTGPGQLGSPNLTEATPLLVQAGSIWESIDIRLAGRVLSVSHVQGRPGTIVEIPIHLSDPSDIGGVVFGLSFDPRILAFVESGGVSPGPLIPARFTVTARALSEGLILVTVLPPFTNRGATLNPTSGELLRVRLRVATQAQPGTVSPLELSTALALRPTGELVGLLVQQATLTVIP